MASNQGTIYLKDKGDLTLIIGEGECKQRFVV